jgi:hypothetical protein
MKDLEGKVVFITGGASGIGLGNGANLHLRSIYGRLLARDAITKTQCFMVPQRGFEPLTHALRTRRSF